MSIRLSVGVGVFVVAAIAGAVGCNQPPPQQQAPAPAAKRRISKMAAPELGPVPAVDRSTKKIAANKPGGGRVAVMKAATPPPTPISLAAPVNAILAGSDTRLDDGSLADFYSYSGTRGERVTVTLTSRAFDAYLLIGVIRNGVFDPRYEDDDSGGNTDAKIDVTLDATGPVVIVANALNKGEAGAYALAVSSAGSGGAVPASNTGNAGAGGTRTTTPGIAEVTAGTPASGRLEAGDRQMSRDKTYYDYWLFEGRAGQQVTITMRSDAVDSYLLLKRGTPGHGQVIAEDDDSGGGLHARISAALPESGTYTVVANSAEAATGAYTLLVEIAGGSPPASSPSPASSGIPYGDRYAGGGDPADKYALVVGIDDYPGTDNDLRGPVADAGLFRDVLIKKFGFTPSNVVMLTNADASREHILNAFVRHLGQAGPQGSAVFYYSGHGTQMPNNVALTAPIDPETDGRDEALFVWGTDRASSIILDDEIGYLIDQLKTDRVLLVHDSCNSGTSSRGAANGGLPKEVTFERVGGSLFWPGGYFVGAKAAPPSTTRDVFETRRQHALLAGSKDQELSWTASGWPDKGGLASVFTYYLVTALEGANDTATLAQIMERVRTQTTAYTQKTYQETQTPQISGTMGGRAVGTVLR